jgi:hypothetical protein
VPGVSVIAVFVLNAKLTGERPLPSVALVLALTRVPVASLQAPGSLV